MLGPIFTSSRWLPELDNPTVAYVLLVLGTIGLVAELTSTLFLGRMALYFIALTGGVLGVVRRHRHASTRP